VAMLECMKRLWWRL